MDKNELKMLAMRDEVANLTERVADLRADLTIVSREKQQVESERDELQRSITEMEVAKNVEGQANPTTPEDS